MTNNELNKYASSSFSGADIRVIANLNAHGLENIKKQVSGHEDDLKKLQLSVAARQGELDLQKEIQTRNQNILDGGDLKTSHDAAVAEVAVAEAAVRAKLLSIEVLTAERGIAQTALTDAVSDWIEANGIYEACLAGLPTTDISSCAFLQDDDQNGQNVATADAALDVKIAALSTAAAELNVLKAVVAEKQAVVDDIKKSKNHLKENVTNAIKQQATLNEELKKLEDPVKDKRKQLAEVQKILGNSYLELGTVQTISCQSHRPKAAVRALGSTYARGYTRGPRTIAGSMIFTVINKQSLHHLCNLMSSSFSSSGNDNSPSTILPDQLLPVDLTFIMANEYGAVSRMALYGLEFLNTGYTFSIEDLLLEEVVQFVARDIDPMSSIFDPQNHQKSRQDTLSDKPVTGKETLRDYLVARQKTLDRRRF